MHTRERVGAVTVRVTTLKGAGAGLYYVEALGGYYLDGGEPAGLWRGRGAAALGLVGEVDDAMFLSLMAGLDPATGEPLGRRYGDHSVRGFDATALAPKSVSVLFALGDDAVRRAVLEAHDAAVAAMVDWVEDHAHTRYRLKGEVRVHDAQGIVAATFRQHTSRALDPQLHTHVVIPNRVLADDGRWLALDARTLKLDQRTLSALYHAGLRAELTRTLGVEWQAPVNGIAEMRGLAPELLEEFSSRTAAVERRVEEKLERFEESFERAPTPRERWRLEREAVVESRPAKAHDLDAEALHAEWAQRALAIGREPQRTIEAAVSEPARRPSLDAVDLDQVVVRALAALSESQSAWRPAELVRELAAAVPSDVGVAAAELAPWLDDLAERTIAERLVELSRPVPPGVPLRRDGRPATESALQRALTTPDILAQEERLLAWAERRMEAGGRDVAVEGDERLSGPQREVAAEVAGDRELVLVVGPAGTGKTTALAPAVESLRAQGRAVFGVAPSAAAAEVLSVEAGLGADTLDKLLVEHRLARPPDHRYDLPTGATLIVDEAAMVSTPKLAELAQLADRRGWRLALAGDPLQFSAVGRGGMFAHLLDCHGAVELDRVHRFVHGWEREASLRLRQGDPDVLSLYEDHGRIHGGGRRKMERAVVEAWREAGAHGQSAAMTAPTNETVVALNQRAQALRLQAGEINLHRPSAPAGPYRLYVGDVVATRRNDRDLRTDCGLMVKNRDQWEVAAVHRGGALTVSGRTGSVRLPAEYVARHVELAYAQTSHAAQGRTVDRSFLFLDGAADMRGVYVPMTRGRYGNEAFVVLSGEQTARDVLAEALARSWIDRPAVARRAELAGPERHAGGDAAERPLDAGALRSLIEREHEIGHTLARAASVQRHCGEQLERDSARRAEVTERADGAEAARQRAHEVLDRYDGPLARRLHRDEIGQARGDLNQAQGALASGRAELAELDQRIVELQGRLAEAAATLRDRPALEHERHGVRRELDSDLSARSAGLGDDAPDHVLDRLGPRPQGGAAAELWDEAAARLDQHRSAFGRDAPPDRGRSWRFEETPEMANGRAASQACDRLDRALGRGRGIEPPGLELSISL